MQPIAVVWFCRVIMQVLGAVDSKCSMGLLFRRLWTTRAQQLPRTWVDTQRSPRGFIRIRVSSSWVAVKRVTPFFQEWSCMEIRAIRGLD